MRALEKKYFPLIATIFIFILVSNLIGYIPLPVDSTDKFNLFGAHLPSFQIYAADTNVAFPLVLSLGVFVLFLNEGIKHHGPIGYLKSLMPGGVKGPIVLLIFPIEILSVFLRLISLTVRLWANLLAGHLLIAFMGGTLGVLVGLQLVSWFLLPARDRDLPLRGRPDRGPAGLHLFHLDRHLHRWSGRVPLARKEPTMLHALNALLAGRGNPSNTASPRAGRSRSASVRAAVPPARAPGSGPCSTPRSSPRRASPSCGPTSSATSGSASR